MKKYFFIATLLLSISKAAFAFSTTDIETMWSSTDKQVVKVKCSGDTPFEPFGANLELSRATRPNTFHYGSRVSGIDGIEAYNISVSSEENELWLAININFATYMAKSNGTKAILYGPTFMISCEIIK